MLVLVVGRLGESHSQCGHFGEGNTHLFLPGFKPRIVKPVGYFQMTIFKDEIQSVMNQITV
jgi:hypothetical protein